MIGVLIGRGGETISKIQKESQARIEINKEPTDSLQKASVCQSALLIRRMP